MLYKILQSYCAALRSASKRICIPFANFHKLNNFVLSLHNSNFWHNYVSNISFLLSYLTVSLYIISLCNFLLSTLILILIIDTFNFPAEHIINHFKYKKAAELNENCIYTKEFTSYTYFIHKELIENIEHVKYYFTEIFEVVEDRVHYINKKKGIWKIYDTVNKNLNERRNKEVVEDFFDKSEFLPHLKAESVDVQFPDIDDEEL